MLKLLLLLLLFCLLMANGTDASTEDEGRNSVEKYRLDEKSFNKIRTIHTNWYVHSMKALIAQLSKTLLPKLDYETKESLLDCLYKIHDKKDLVESSKCIVDAKENYELHRRIRKNKNYGIPGKAKTPKHLIREFKRRWRHTLLRTHKIRRAKRSLRRLVVDSVSKSDSQGFVIKSMDHLDKLKSPGENKSPVIRVTKLLKSFFSKSKNETEDESWSQTYRALLTLKKKMEQKEKEPGARVYNQRMYDLVLDIPPKSGADFEMLDKVKMPKLMKNAFNLMAALDGSSDLEKPNYKFLSPRFASVMPDKNENRGKLSPSILSFYNDDSEDQILPMPKMLEATGLHDKDRDSVLETIMDISGAKTIVQEALKILKAVDMPELDVAITDHAKKSMKMVEDIQKSYNGRQKTDLKKKGFALIEPHQMEKLMAEQGIAGRDDIFNIKEYAKLSILQRKDLVWDMIRQIAYGPPQQTGEFTNATSTRVKRQASVFGPHWLSPTVLTGVLFTPIYGLNVLGPTVLSPGVFTPLILNPSVLSPYVFSPTVVIPFILSPYLLSPYVFSPLIMAPFILNPYVLSPNVFNPYVLSPLVLSPTVICPDVVSPMVLGGAILSPGVASPSFFSKSYLMAYVLSPSFLS